MIESLLPLLHLYLAPTPQAPMAEPMQSHPMMMEWESEEEERERMHLTPPTQKPDRVVEQGKERMWRERPTQIRRKGHMQTPGNYGARRMQHAVETDTPAFDALQYTQRTHRGMIRSMRRLERENRDYSRGCAFPCVE